MGKFFPDVHRDTQFVILNFGGSSVSCKKPDFIFGVMKVEEIDVLSRHVVITGADIRMLNPNTRTCPIFHSNRDAAITKRIYKRLSVLIDKTRKGSTGNPWSLAFTRMFDQTNDAELFRDGAWLQEHGFRIRGNTWLKKKEHYLPLYEAKMFRMWDHRFGNVFEETTNWINQGQTIESSLAQHANPEFLVQPRYWASEEIIRDRLPSAHAYLAFRDITNPTNARTMISAFTPSNAGFINTAPIIHFPDEVTYRQRACLAANLCSFVFDYVARNKIHGRHMNFFALEQLPALTSDTYAKGCQWERKKKLEAWISERVLKLTCTAEDMLPLADACQFTAGSFKKEYGGRLNKWDEAERAKLMAELDAAYFHLYGIDRDDAEYILSTFKGIHDRSPLIPNHQTTAEHILAIYDDFAARQG